MGKTTRRDEDFDADAIEEKLFERTSNKRPKKAQRANRVDLSQIDVLNYDDLPDIASSTSENSVMTIPAAPEVTTAPAPVMESVRHPVPLIATDIVTNYIVMKRAKVVATWLVLLACISSTLSLFVFNVQILVSAFVIIAFCLCGATMHRMLTSVIYRAFSMGFYLSLAMVLVLAAISLATFVEGGALWRVSTTLGVFLGMFAFLGGIVSDKERTQATIEITKVEQQS